MEYREIFIKYDQNEATFYKYEPCTIYESIEELLKETTDFYHDTFSCEDNYNENYECKTVIEAVDLWEGSGYGIAQVIKGNY